MNFFLKAVLPILILVIGAFVAKTLSDSREVPVAIERQAPVPRVQALLSERTSYQVYVPSQGSVVPQLESELVSEVPGQVVYVSVNLVNGGYFDEGEELLRLDASDFQLALAQSKLEVARAQRRLTEEEADAAVAKREWESMGEGEATPLTLRVPQIAEAKATLVAAEASQSKAQRDLERTSIRATFSGRVRSKRVGLGQFVPAGFALATVYGTDVAEVRLPLPDEELAVLQLPFGSSAEQLGQRPAVQLSSNFAGQIQEWNAHIVRTEGEIDPMTRMVMAVAEIENPYGVQPGGASVPLALGMFVRAKIKGAMLEDVLVLPRSALRDGQQIYVIDAEERLSFVDALLVRTERESVILRAELPDNSRIVTSPLEIATDGMLVWDLTRDTPPKRKPKALATEVVQ